MGFRVKEDVLIRYQAWRNLAINNAIRTTVHTTIKIDMYSSTAV